MENSPVRGSDVPILIGLVLAVGSAGAATVGGTAVGGSGWVGAAAGGSVATGAAWVGSAFGASVGVAAGAQAPSTMLAIRTMAHNIQNLRFISLSSRIFSKVW
jgi:hypothetical protein